MRITYFVTSYHSIGSLVRLLRTLRRGDPDCHLVVHHDVFQSPIAGEDLDQLGVHLFTSENPIIWGDLTLESLRWRIFRWALENLEFDWLVLLSEQDYPLAPLSDLKTHLERDAIDAVIGAERVTALTDPDMRSECRRRYGYAYAVLPSVGLERRLPSRAASFLRTARTFTYRVVNTAQPWVRFYYFADALALPTRIGLRRSSEDFREGFPCWLSSAWYALSRRSMERVVTFLDTTPDYETYCARTVVPVESATQSIVCNDPELRVSHEDIHYVRFSDSLSGRPDVFAEGDFDELASSGRFFARKFPVGDSAIHALLDERVLAGAPSDDNSRGA